MVLRYGVYFSNTIIILLIVLIVSIGVVGISEIIIRPGLINVDFADVRAIMGNAGTALMGIGKLHVVYATSYMHTCTYTNTDINLRTYA